MIPLTVTREELALARSWVDEEVEAATKGLKKKPDITIGTMIETPRAAICADEIAEEADFFSFGTNDLTQMTFGFSRDDVESRMMPAYLEQGLLKRNPFETIDQTASASSCASAPALGRQTKPEAQARRVRRARRRPRVDRPVLRRRPRLRQLLAVPGADRPPGRGPGDRRCRQRHEVTSLLAAESGSNFVDLDVEPWHWAVLLGVVVALLLFDLLVLHREAHEVGPQEAAIESAVWVSIGLGFGVLVWIWFGGDGDDASTSRAT